MFRFFEQMVDPFVDYKEVDAHFSLRCNVGLLDLEAVDEKSGNQLFEAGLINASQE